MDSHILTVNMFEWKLFLQDLRACLVITVYTHGSRGFRKCIPRLRPDCRPEWVLHGLLCLTRWQSDPWQDFLVSSVIDALYAKARMEIMVGGECLIHSTAEILECFHPRTDQNRITYMRSTCVIIIRSASGIYQLSESLKKMRGEWAAEEKTGGGEREEKQMTFSSNICTDARISHSFMHVFFIMVLKSGHGYPVVL